MKYAKKRNILKRIRGSRVLVTMIDAIRRTAWGIVK